MRSEKIIIRSLPGGVSGFAARVDAGADLKTCVAVLELLGRRELHAVHAVCQQLFKSLGFFFLTGNRLFPLMPAPQSWC